MDANGSLPPSVPNAWKGSLLDVAAVVVLDEMGVVERATGVVLFTGGVARLFLGGSAGVSSGALKGSLPKLSELGLCD